ncbi:ATP-binding cassette sub-family G member 1 [Trichonephila inaurata madagascariensis]|uniref:ATP-binding cassette sub-family G member 1 n=1 Tax=Trichonephila inaurata madagascariensis TaxID=2747483 RepID=A0A8X7BPZ5_9ARAC|nr:ATP-binding cassette sub-family G member 1 [Trichonephila inaurata madagascariensis]
MEIENGHKGKDQKNPGATPVFGAVGGGWAPRPPPPCPRGTKVDKKPSIFKENALESSYGGYATSSWNQFRVLTYRSLVCTLREPMATQLRFFAHLIVGLLLGMLYFGIGNDASKIFNNSGFLFFSLLFLIFTAMMPTVLTFPMEKTIFAREYINSWYSTKIYYLSKTVAEIPFQILFPIIYCSIVYWMTSQPNELVRFGLFVLSSIMISLVAQSVGLLIGAATSVQNAVFLAPVVGCPTSRTSATATRAFFWASTPGQAGTALRQGLLPFPGTRRLSEGDGYGRWEPVRRLRRSLGILLRLQSDCLLRPLLQNGLQPMRNWIGALASSLWRFRYSSVTSFTFMRWSLMYRSPHVKSSLLGV